MFYPDKNDKLTMIGFNLGPALALTEEGILSQCTSGMISQERENCYMYSIPSLHGSSGAPVLNQKGELVAINFAGLSATQNFNYGIKVKYLSELYY
jgi:V8-like Glu-specific endopeptidase